MIYLTQFMKERHVIGYFELKKAIQAALFREKEFLVCLVLLLFHLCWVFFCKLSEILLQVLRKLKIFVKLKLQKSLLKFFTIRILKIHVNHKSRRYIFKFLCEGNFEGY